MNNSCDKCGALLNADGQCEYHQTLRQPTGTAAPTVPSEQTTIARRTNDMLFALATIVFLLVNIYRVCGVTLGMYTISSNLQLVHLIAGIISGAYSTWGCSETSANFITWVTGVATVTLALQLMALMVTFLP